MVGAEHDDAVVSGEVHLVHRARKGGVSRSEGDGQRGSGLRGGSYLRCQALTALCHDVEDRTGRDMAGEVADDVPGAAVPSQEEHPFGAGSPCGAQFAITDSSNAAGS